mgnify:CR=1 FL=1
MTRRYGLDGAVEFVNAAGQVSGRWAGQRLPDEDIYRLALRMWGPGWRPVIMTAIALAESGGWTKAEGDLLLQDSRWGPSEGLWQIRVPAGARGSMFDVDKNVRAAHVLWERRGFRPWGAFTNGAYLRYLPRARSAATAVRVARG